jgi:hypothetical protein
MQVPLPCEENKAVRVSKSEIGHESLATTQKYLEPSKETESQLEAMKLPF